MFYYEILENGKIGQFTENEEIAKEIGLKEKTERKILMEDGFVFFEGEKPKKPLELLKKEKIEELRKKANDYILSQYSYYKQLNIIRIGTEEEKNNMSSFIDGVRNKVNQLELDINSCNTEEELSTINYNIYDNNK